MLLAVRMAQLAQDVLPNIKATVTLKRLNRALMLHGKPQLARTVHRDEHLGVSFRYIDCPWCRSNHCHMSAGIGQLYYAPCGAGNRGKMYETAGE